MLNIRTILFGLTFGLLDVISLPVIKSISDRILPLKYILIPILMYGFSPFIFLEALKGETLTIMNLVWDLTSDITVTLIGLLYFQESISPVKFLGVCLSFVSLFLMTYEGDGWSKRLKESFTKIVNIYA